MLKYHALYLALLEVQYGIYQTVLVATSPCIYYLVLPLVQELFLEQK